MATTLNWRVPKRRLFSTPVPPETETYKPMSHKDLADMTLTAIKNAGFKLISQEYNSAKEGKVANARYVIDYGDEEMRLEIAWQNSYDKTLSLKFAIGTRIFICSNGCVSGDFGAFKRRHKGEIKEFTPETITASIMNAKDVFKRMQDERDAMKKLHISSKLTAEIIGGLFLYEEVIGSTQLNLIKQELKTPTHDYGAPNSLWELYQYVTYTMKNMHPRHWMDNHIKVHEYFLKVLDQNELVSDLIVPLDVRPPLDLEDLPIMDPNQLSLLDVIIENEQEEKE